MQNWDKKWTIAAIAAVVLLVVGVLYARAAEAADKGGPGVSPLIPGLTVTKGSWTGPYIGADAGVNLLDAGFDREVGVLTADGLSGKDWTYGVRGGFDWQLPSTPIVIGVLGGYSWGDVSASLATPFIPDTSFSIQPTWHAGGRVGIALAGKSLIYIGGAWSQADVAASFTTMGNVTSTASQTVNGKMLLAGLETTLAPMWTLGIEYSFTRYESVSFFEANEHAFDPDVHAVKARLTFRPFSK